MSVRKVFTTIVSIVMLVVLFNALPAAAQTAIPQGEITPQEIDKPCPGSDPSLTRYDRWVMDIPCANETSDTIAPTSYPLPAFTSLGSINYNTFTTLSRYNFNNWNIVGACELWEDGNALKAPMEFATSGDDEIQPRARPGSIQVLYTSKPPTGKYNLFLRISTEYITKAITSSTTANNVQGAWAPDGMKIVFVSDRDGDLEIYTIQVDGSNTVRLTYHSAADFNPQFSPDGKQISWVRAVDNSHGVIYVMNADGSNPHPITLPLKYPGHPVWSPDNAQIAFDHDYNSDGWRDLAVINADGSNYRRIASSSKVDFFAGSFPNLSTPDRAILLTKILYSDAGGSWSVLQMCIASTAATSNQIPTCLPNSYLDQSPDMVLLDHVTPSTRVEAIPKYTPVGPFNITITGYDTGIAKLQKLELMYRDGVNNYWNFLEKDFSSGPVTLSFNIRAQETYYFRSRGMDWTGNREEKPEGYDDAYTHGYVWQLFGKVVDNREIGVPNPGIQTNPVYEDQNDEDHLGNFHRYVPTDMVTISVNKPNYQIRTHVVSGSVETYHQFFLTPQNNLINNGDFENALNYWTKTGQYSANLSTNQYTGTYSVRLGEPILSNPSTVLTSDGSSTFPSILIDKDGTSHLVWQSANGINYQSRPTGGSWSTPINFSPEGVRPNIYLTNDGTLYLAWSDKDSNKLTLRYAFRSATGVWSSTENITGLRDCTGWYDYCGLPKIAVDSLNTVHVVWNDSGGTWYSQKPISGAWSEPRNIEHGAYAYAMAVASDDKLYIFYYDGARYVTRSVGGIWSSPITTMFSSPNIYAEPNSSGGLHVSWGENGLSYATLMSDGSWLNYEYGVITTYSSCPSHMVADGDAVHFTANCYGLFQYRRRTSDGIWSPVITLSSTGYHYQTDLAVHENHLEVVWTAYSGNQTDIKFEECNLVDISIGTLSQTIAIPSSLNKPTLSFMHYEDQWHKTGGLFEMKINDTVVFSATGDSGKWQHQWVDLTPWLGQTVTLSFNSEINLRSSPLYTYLDEISIGEWLTPIVTSVTPDTNLNNTGAKFIVTGENFLNGATIKLSSFPASSVTWVDEHTMTFTLDAGFQPGFHDVWVINPGGQENVKISALQVGEPFFLPAVMR